MSEGMEMVQDKANEWLAMFRTTIEEVALPFIEPHRCESEDRQEITFEWWSEARGERYKKLTIWIDWEDVTYIRAWGGAKGPMMNGDADYYDTALLLWQWFLGEGEREDAV